MRSKFLISTILLTAYSFASQAQTEQQVKMKKMIDSITNVRLSEYAERYPLLRQGFIATDFMGRGYVNAQLKGKQLFNSEGQLSRIRANFNIPFAQWGKNTITGTINYQQQRLQFSDLTHVDPSYSGNGLDVTKATMAFTGSYTRRDSLFHHAVNYSGSISVITNGLSSVEKINYLGSITIPLKRTQYNAFTVGMVVIIDKSSPIPVIPVVSYWHKFKTSDLELFVDLPSRAVLRKQFSKRLWASAGSELGNSISFFNINSPMLPQNAIYSTLEIRSGLNVEYLLTKKVIFGINGGVLSTASSKMFGHNDKSNDYFAKTQNGSVPYISVSLSFLPFLKSIW